jgi:hypothetical protein
MPDLSPQSVPILEGKVVLTKRAGTTQRYIEVMIEC